MYTCIYPYISVCVGMFAYSYRRARIYTDTHTTHTHKHKHTHTHTHTHIHTLQFSKFKKSVRPWVGFSKLQLTQISLSLKTFHWNKKSKVWEQKYVWLFYYFDFERNYDVLKRKSPCILLNKNANIGKNEAESKLENLTHVFINPNLVPQLTE